MTAGGGRACTGYGPDGPCGTTPARLYPAGWRCAAHTPAALAGRPEPGAGRYCPPVLCWCGHCPAAPGQDQDQDKAPSGLPAEAAALAYIRRGWPVFVLGRSKRPVANCPACKHARPGHDPAACGCLTCHGFHAATTSPARLAAMLAAVPRGLLAIRTGTVAGLAIIDIDPRNGGAIDPALMAPTAAVATGGGGWHLYYRHPGGPLLPALPGRAGVDVKADGGYVVAPPSVHPGTGRPYRWAGERPVSEMPPALAAALAPPPAADRPAAFSGPVPARRAGGISSPAALLAAHLRTVENAPEGRRRVTLYGAARGIARMITAGAVTDADAIAALTAAGLAAQQTERDIRAAIEGAFRDEGAAA